MQLNLAGLRMPRSSEAAATLLNAVLAVGSGLELSEVLTRIVRSACNLVGAHYGALGVLRPDGAGLMEFVTEGMTAQEVARLGAPPFGHGVLGLLIREPRPFDCQRSATTRKRPGSRPGIPS